MEFTTRLGLRSQTVRLFEAEMYKTLVTRSVTGLSPSLVLSSNRLLPSTAPKFNLYRLQFADLSVAMPQVPIRTVPMK